MKIRTIVFALVVLAMAGCKKDPAPALVDVKVTGTYELNVAQPLSTLTLTGTATLNGQTVEGILDWLEPDKTFDKAGEYDAAWTFTPEDAGRYAAAEGMVAVVVPPDVYACGSVGFPNGVGTIWKNGKVLYTLEGSTDLGAVAVSEGNVYVFGNVRNANGIMVGKVWKNDKPLYTLADETGETFISSLSVSGGEVYACGRVLNENGINVGKVWKNGEELYTLGNGIFNVGPSSVSVSDGDVYTCGAEKNANGIMVGKVWKNDEELYILTDETRNASLWSLSVSGDDVYTCGRVLNENGINVGKVWKNDKELYALTDGSMDSDVISLVLSGGYVYTFGCEGEICKVWKNDKELYSDLHVAWGSIAGWGGDIYVGACYYDKDTRRAKIWKNGVDLYGDFENTMITGIVVK